MDHVARSRPKGPSLLLVGRVVLSLGLFHRGLYPQGGHEESLGCDDAYLARQLLKRLDHRTWNGVYRSMVSIQCKIQRMVGVIG
jgi:hypothetical protein